MEENTQIHYIGKTVNLLLSGTAHGCQTKLISDVPIPYTIKINHIGVLIFFFYQPFGEMFVVKEYSKNFKEFSGAVRPEEL